MLEDCVQYDADFDGCFTLRPIPEGQHIACTVNGRPFEVDMPCPSSVDAAVQIVHETERLVIRIRGISSPEILQKSCEQDNRKCRADS